MSQRIRPARSTKSGEGGMRKEFYDKLVAHVNRKSWWHVPPVDPDAYKRRRRFYSVSFAAAEFWGRPLDEPQKVKIAKPLVNILHRSTPAVSLRRDHITPSQDTLGLDTSTHHPE